MSAAHGYRTSTGDSYVESQLQLMGAVSVAALSQRGPAQAHSRACRPSKIDALQAQIAALQRELQGDQGQGQHRREDRGKAPTRPPAPASKAPAAPPTAARQDVGGQPALDLHAGRIELHRAHQPAAFRRRRLHLRPEHGRDRAAASRRRRQRPPRAHRRPRHLHERLELRSDLRLRRLLGRLRRTTGGRARCPGGGTSGIENAY